MYVRWCIQCDGQPMLAMRGERKTQSRTEGSPKTPPSWPICIHCCPIPNHFGLCNHQLWSVLLVFMHVAPFWFTAGQPGHLVVD